MVEWFMHDIPAWMDGTETLPDGPYRVYHVVCQLIYLNDGPITNNEHGIAGRCNQHILAYRANLAKLIAAGKLTLTDGRLSNERASHELERVHARRMSSAKGGRATSGRSRANPPATSAQPPMGHGEVGSGSGGDQPDNALNSNGSASSALSEQQHHKSRGEERRGEKKDAAPNGARPPELDLGQAEPTRKRTTSEAETDLFRRGKEILGDNAGGVIAQLLKAKERNVSLARAAIEQASTKQNPREYIGAVIRGAAAVTDDRTPRVRV